jgi:transposase
LHSLFPLFGEGICRPHDDLRNLARSSQIQPRHGTTTLFAALNVLTGVVIGRCLPRHRNAEFLKFLRVIDREVPQGLQIHMICDNYGTHKHANVKEWLAKSDRRMIVSGGVGWWAGWASGRGYGLG